MATRPTLKPGAKGKKGTQLGEAIFIWRVFIGLPPAKDVTEFDYGPLSVERTKAFQRKQGLKIDGEVGPSTWAKYDELQYGPPAPPSPTQVQPPTPKPQPTPAPQSPIAAAAAATAPFLSVPKSVEEAKEQVVKSLNATPLWLRVVGGTVSAGITFFGLKKLFGKS